MFELDYAQLWLGILFSGIGFVAFQYGRKMELFVPMLLGITLMVYPWFVTSTLWLVVVGTGLTGALWVLRE